MNRPGVVRRGNEPAKAGFHLGAGSNETISLFHGETATLRELDNA
jgi:hypothetical protein